MKKGLIIGILLIILAGSVFAQSTEAPSIIRSTIESILDNVISINEKTCGEFPIVLVQQTPAGQLNTPLTIKSSSSQNNLLEKEFLLVFPEREGELIKIKDINLYGYFHSGMNQGDTCEISFNGNNCNTFVKNSPSNGENEYFYETLPSSCIDSLDFDGVNYLGVSCPILTGNNNFFIDKVFYDATWKSC